MRSKLFTSVRVPKQGSFAVRSPEYPVRLHADCRAARVPQKLRNPPCDPTLNLLCFNNFSAYVRTTARSQSRTRRALCKRGACTRRKLSGWLQQSAKRALRRVSMDEIGNEFQSYAEHSALLTRITKCIYLRVCIVACAMRATFSFGFVLAPPVGAGLDDRSLGPPHGPKHHGAQSVPLSGHLLTAR